MIRLLRVVATACAAAWACCLIRWAAALAVAIGAVSHHETQAATQEQRP